MSDDVNDHISRAQSNLRQVWREHVLMCRKDGFEVCGDKDPVGRNIKQLAQLMEVDLDSVVIERDDD